MKRLHIGILIVLLCLISVGGWIWRSGVTARESEQYRIPPACVSQDVRELTVEVAHAESGGASPDSVRLVRTDTPDPDLPEAAVNLRASWEITEPNLGEADALFAQRIIGDLCYLPTAQRIERPDLSALGLENPRAQVKLEIDSLGPQPKVIWKFQFGSALPDRRVSLRIERAGEPSLTYSIPDKFFQLLTVPADRFRNRRVLHMPLDRIDAVKVIADGRERFQLERAGADWRLLAGGKELPASTDAIVSFVNRLGTLRALEVLESRVSAEDCRKQAAAFELRFEGMDRSQETVRFGRPRDPSGENRERILACGSARRSLFGVHRDLWKYLNVGAESFRPR